MCYNAQDIDVDEHKKYMCVWVSIADTERSAQKSPQTAIEITSGASRGTEQTI